MKPIARPPRTAWKAEGRATRLTHAGKPSGALAGTVSPPVYRFSTVTFDSVRDYEEAGRNRTDNLLYGRLGSPTTWALEEALCELEGAADCVLAPSGLAAIQLALLATLGAGDHVLVADTVYAPVRNLCKRVLPRFGIEPQFYDPLLGAGIQALLRPNTRVVYVESPGSQTFEVQDIPAIAEVAHRHGALVIADNAWASGYFSQALALGADISVLPCTKYVVGHSDAMVGAVLANESVKERVRRYWADTGTAIGPDDAWLALRGLRTLPVRMEQHYKNALAVAQWLEARAEVESVLYPALPTHPQHALWRRDFRGACGLFSFVLKNADDKQSAAFIDTLELFAIGASWGGYESLVLTAKPERTASACPWAGERSAIRLHVGLEDVNDLIADLERGFASM